MKKILLLSFIAVLAACSDAEQAEPLPQQSEPVEQGANETGVATGGALPTEEELTEEPFGIQAEALIENAPPMPTNFEEIIAYPVGPFSGNSTNAQRDGKNTMTSEQLADAILNTLPAFTAQDLTDPTFLDRWFNALHSLIAEDYRDPQAILDDFSFEAFGKLMINGEAVQFKDKLNVLIILDASGSMLNTLNGETMMQIAQNEINALVDRLPDEVNIGLRVYGGKGSNKGDSCVSTQLLEPIAANNKSKIKTSLATVTPVGWTPIAASLKEAANDFADFSSEANTNFIYLISDGMETCDGNPVQEVQNLAASNIEPIVNVIGFNVDASGQTQLENIAKQGNGQYIHVSNKQAFSDSMKSLEKIVQAWEKRKHQLIDDALNARGKLGDELYDLEREWSSNMYDEFNALMLIMDELNFSTDYFEDKQVLNGQVHRELLDKISAKSDLYRTELGNKYKEITNNLDAMYESIVDSLN